MYGGIVEFKIVSECIWAFVNDFKLGQPESSTIDRGYHADSNQFSLQIQTWLKPSVSDLTY